MFESSVAGVVVVAAIVAAVVALVIGSFLARRIARPIERLAAAAQQTAEGDLRATAPVEGPAEVRALADAFNVMVDRLAEQDAVRREFVVNASHELRTPLTNLQGYLEALDLGVAGDGGVGVYGQGFYGALGYSEATSGIAVYAAAGDPTVRALRVEGRAEFTRSGRTSIAPGAVVHARSDELAQVISNLLQNAIRYTPAGGHVNVALARVGGDAVVRVTNTGPEIPADDLPRVWERFFRVERSRDRSSGGAGIGLAIVKRLIEEAGGRVGATSEAGVTTFWFSLPS